MASCRVSILFCFVILVPLVSGCCRGMPVLSVTPIPGHQFEVNLCGPATDGTYCYFVCSQDGNSVFRTRDLGVLDEDQLGPASIESIGDQVFFIQWGDEENGPFAIFDISRQIYVTDSNPANRDEETFIRPEHGIY